MPVGSSVATAGSELEEKRLALDDERWYASPGGFRAWKRPVPSCSIVEHLPA
jgi:hypothetical protein